MAGTSTIPAFSGTANRRTLSIGLIDVSGDEWSESLIVPGAMTDAQAQAFIDAYQAATQASAYKAVDRFVYQGARLATNATDDQRSEVQNGINYLFRNTSNLAAETVRVVAPVTGLMVGETDVPDMASALVTALSAAVVGIDSDLALESGQYSVNSERAGSNDKVPVA